MRLVILTGFFRGSLSLQGVLLRYNLECCSGRDASRAAACSDEQSQKRKSSHNHNADRELQGAGTLPARACPRSAEVKPEVMGVWLVRARCLWAVRDMLFIAPLKEHAIVIGLPDNSQ